MNCWIFPLVNIQIFCMEKMPREKQIFLKLYTWQRTSRSHRGAKDKQMIQFESDEAHIKMIVNKMDVNHRIDMHLRKNGKKGVAIDRVNIRKMVDLFGMSSVIMFSPEDLDIVKDGPAERRKFMNAEISQMSGLYFSDFQNYKKIIDQRNKLLKQIYFEPRLKDTLDIWDEQLATVGENIIRERKILSSR